MRELVWIACTDCLARHPQPPKRGCTVCEGTGQYQALKPLARWEQDRPPDDKERNLAWVRLAKDKGYR